MNHFVSMPDDRRKLVCEQTAARTGLVASSVEKDFWVSWALRELFSLPAWGEHLTFKGGTSLSKGWKLIERFSEDIDIVIARDALGFAGKEAPENAESNKQKRKRLEALKKACQKCVNEEVLSLLLESIQKSLPDRLKWRLESDPEDVDGQTLLFTYPTVFPEHPDYLRQVVKIEMGARSDTDPSVAVDIQSLIAESFPGMFPDRRFQVRAVMPVRTFWEKAMLLHEETFRPPSKKKRKRGMARHYYDLFRLINEGIAAEAILDIDLFFRIVEHREVYFKYTWVDYKTLMPGSLRLIPLEEQLSDWYADYAAMQVEMFYGEVPDFDKVLQVVEGFQTRFNQ